MAGRFRVAGVAAVGIVVVVSLFSEYHGLLGGLVVAALIAFLILLVDCVQATIRSIRRRRDPSAG